MLIGTFEVDIANTKKLLQGERGQKIREKDIIVSDHNTIIHLPSRKIPQIGVTISLMYTCILYEFSRKDKKKLLHQVVGESGLFTPDDIAFVQEAGCRAVTLSTFFSISVNSFSFVDNNIV